MAKLKDYIESRIMETSTTFLTSELGKGFKNFKENLKKIFEKFFVIMKPQKVGYLQATPEQRALGSKWNTGLINAVVLYIGSQAIQQITNQNTSPSPETVSHNAFMDIFQVKWKVQLKVK